MLGSEIAAKLVHRRRKRHVNVILYSVLRYALHWTDDNNNYYYTSVH